MSDTELLKAFKNWKKRHGPERAAAELALRKVNGRTVDRLRDDKYVQSPRGKLRRALLEIIGQAS